MRICGRLLRPSNLAERRLLLSHFGASTFRVPRSHNVFAIVRRVERYLAKNEDLIFLKRLAVPNRVTFDVNVQEPVAGECDAAAGD